MGNTRDNGVDTALDFILALCVVAVNDPTGKALLAKYRAPLPNRGLTREEVRQILQYLRRHEQHQRIVLH